MKIPLGMVIDYTHSKPELAKQAFTEFFRGLPKDKDPREELFPLFAEWLIFNYKQPSGMTFFNEFVLKNPLKLSKKELLQFEEIAETQLYGGFEIRTVARSKWIELEHLFSGSLYKVYDTLGSETIAQKGMIIGRIGKIRERWYLVGSTPHYLPQTFTQRFKDHMHGQTAYSSPKDLLNLLNTKHEYTEPKNLTKDAIKKKRDSLKKQFEIHAKKYNCPPIFDKLVKEVYNENDSSPGDTWNLYVRLGIPQTFLAQHTQLFQDIWNYFPHKLLNGKSPVEMFQKHRRT